MLRNGGHAIQSGYSSPNINGVTRPMKQGNVDKIHSINLGLIVSTELSSKNMKCKTSERTKIGWEQN